MRACDILLSHPSGRLLTIEKESAMNNVHSAGQVIHREPGSAQLESEGHVPEVGASVWRYPQTVVVGDIEESERWDGLS